MARARRTSSRKGSSVKRQLGWIRSFTNLQLVDDTPTVEINLVASADWAVGNLNETGTIRRIRCALSVAPEVLSATESTFFWAIYVSDDDASVVGPASVAILDENLLGMGAIIMPVASATVNERLNSSPLDIDIKAMRKIRADQECLLVMRMGTAGHTVSVSGYCSTLFSRGRSG